MKIGLLLQAGEDPRGWRKAHSWIQARQAGDQAEVKVAALEMDQGIIPSKGTILCPPHPAALATARCAYPDRRIEVDSKYAEPELPLPAPGGLPMPSWWWNRRLFWKSLLGQGGESPEAWKRRVVETSAKLIELAKKDGDSVLVGRAWMLRLVAHKLKSIGFYGALWPRFKPGRVLCLQFDEAQKP